MIRIKVTGVSRVRRNMRTLVQQVQRQSRKTYRSERELKNAIERALRRLR